MVRQKETGLGPETKNLAGMGLHVDVGRHHHRSVHVLPESIAVHRIGDLDLCLHPWAQLGCWTIHSQLKSRSEVEDFFYIGEEGGQEAETDNLELREKS